VNDLEQALDNPFAHSIGMVRTVPHPLRADFKTLANPIMLNGERLPSRSAPALGADTEDVLREVGYSDEELERLRAALII
jgi:crotonobetainyl-CoA:carnitine CoA-transferase CaiB-like acyl-CoA transferase